MTRNRGQNICNSWKYLGLYILSLELSVFNTGKFSLSITNSRTSELFMLATV